MIRRPSDATLAKYLPKGPCAFCHKRFMAAHRLIDTIRWNARKGQTIASLADEYNLPRSVVTWLARAPIGKLRKWRRTR